MNERKIHGAWMVPTFRQCIDAWEEEWYRAVAIWVILMQITDVVCHIILMAPRLYASDPLGQTRAYMGSSPSSTSPRVVAETMANFSSHLGGYYHLARACVPVLMKICTNRYNAIAVYASQGAHCRKPSSLKLSLSLLQQS